MVNALLYFLMSQVISMDFDKVQTHFKRLCLFYMSTLLDYTDAFWQNLNTILAIESLLNICICKVFAYPKQVFLYRFSLFYTFKSYTL